MVGYNCLLEFLARILFAKRRGGDPFTGRGKVEKTSDGLIFACTVLTNDELDIVSRANYLFVLLCYFSKSAIGCNLE